MERIKTILIEEETRGKGYLMSLASKRQSLDIQAVCESTVQAKEVLHSHAIDLIIIDILIPFVDAFNFLKNLENPPLIIVISAETEFPIVGFEFSIVDYILRSSLTADRLYKAIEKVNTLHYSKQFIKDKALLKFKDGHRTYLIRPIDILLIRSCGDYVKITTRDERIMVKATLKALEAILPQDSFVRIHRSHIVHLRQIKSYDAAQVRLKNGESLNIGIQFRAGFLKIVNRL